MTDGYPGAEDRTSPCQELDIPEAAWTRLRPQGETLEYAFVPHTDGSTYTALRHSSQPRGTVLVFTPSEWDAFLAGVKDGEFDAL